MSPGGRGGMGNHPDAERGKSRKQSSSRSEGRRRVRVLSPLRGTGKEGTPVIEKEIGKVGTRSSGPGGSTSMWKDLRIEIETVAARFMSSEKRIEIDMTGEIDITSDD